MKNRAEGTKLERKAVLGIMLTLLLMVVSRIVFSFYMVKATLGTVRADGLVDPLTVSIQRGGGMYSFAENIFGEIVVFWEG